MMCVRWLQILLRDEVIEGTLDEGLEAELWFDACVLGELKYMTVGDLDRSRELLAGETAVLVLKFFALGRLFHDLGVNRLSNLDR